MSNVASHCVVHACSDDKDACFSSECKPHTERCSYCDTIPQLFASINGAIGVAILGGLGDEERQDMLHRMFVNHKAIFGYKQHVIRAFAQNTFWADASSTEDETTAYMVQVCK